jgi:hypothetical protein
MKKKGGEQVSRVRGVIPHEKIQWGGLKKKFSFFNFYEK